MKPKLVGINEEIVRWSFEIAINASQDWFLAFTNPTAGPWKRVTAPNNYSKIGEVHRFEIDETRPDLIVVNDKSRTVLIIEAKTNFKDIQKFEQMEKTCQLFQNLSDILRSKSSNEFWGQRSNYEYQLGLLWSSGEETRSQVKNTCETYIQKASRISDVFCIEGSVVNGILRTNSYAGISGKNSYLPS